MIFYMYVTFDPETSSYDSRIATSPMGPNNHAEQLRRAHIKMSDEDKVFMGGKIVRCLGKFDDESGKFEDSNLIDIYKFEKPVKEEKEPGQKNVS